MWLLDRLIVWSCFAADFHSTTCACSWTSTRLHPVEGHTCEGNLACQNLFSAILKNMSVASGRGK